MKYPIQRKVKSFRDIVALSTYDKVYHSYVVDNCHFTSWMREFCGKVVLLDKSDLEGSNYKYRSNPDAYYFSEKWLEAEVYLGGE